MYTAALQEKIDLGVIEKVSCDDTGPVGMTYYMPHSAVIRADKVTTKVRIVFDASCKDNGVSLNDTLHPDSLSCLMCCRRLECIGGCFSLT